MERRLFNLRRGRGFPVPPAGRVILVVAWALLGLIARATEISPLPEHLEFFERKVRPLLAERCYSCHSASSEQLKGGLQLDFRDGLLKGGDSGPAIVPGNPDQSLLVRAVRYTDEHLQMPPKQRLGDQEVANLAEWVRLGAPWPKERAAIAKGTGFDISARRAEHWSWQPIRTAALPEVTDPTWPTRPIDYFVSAKLKAEGLEPAPPAGKRTLIRRLYFDLIGLPPSPSEVADFLADSRPDAYAQLVERLLASPQFGERWARHWLDLVRYSETLGHEFDYANFNAWRYRDYVIRAFNADLPYDQFVREHIAGDLLPQPRRHPVEGFNESVIGTGFYWLGQRVHSPVDVRQEQAEIVDNQIDVATKTFLGLTVACARCHDHKFDAISTRDYYALFGVMASSRYAQRSLAAPETIAPTIEQLRSLKERLRPLIADAWRPQAADLAAYLTAALELPPTADEGSRSNQIFTAAANLGLEPQRLMRWVTALAKADLPAAAAPLARWRNPAPPVASSNGQLDIRALSTPAIDIVGWSREDEAFPDSLSDPGDFVVGDPDKPVLNFLTEPALNSARVSRRLEGILRSPTFTVTNRYVHILAAGSGTRLNVRVDNFTMIRDPIYGGLKRGIDHAEFRWMTVDLETWRGHRAYLEFNDLQTPDPSDEADRKFSPLGYALVSRVVFSDAPVPPTSPTPADWPGRERLPVTTSAADLGKLYKDATIATLDAWQNGSPATPLAREQAAWLQWLAHNSLLEPVPGPATDRLRAALTQFRALEETIPERDRALGMIDGSGVDENVFIRGNHKTPGPTVPRRFLEALGGSDEVPFQSGSGRLDLADALISPDNPFAARVMVNRIWLHLFGRGLVPTPDDFGALGEPPSNLELLDYLADWYRREARWSTKALIRVLVTSSTYRMASRHPLAVAAEKDPQNVRLHRKPIRRLEGEAIRDALLAVSGRLDLTMYGPPVPVYLTEFMDGRGRPGASGPLDGRGRRSIYQEVRRNFLPPMMRTFDFPVPFTTIGRRTVSNVPAQSLILMNDPFVIAEAKAWAKAVLAHPSRSPEHRIEGMYEALLCRPPEPRETAAALSFLNEQAALYGLAPQDHMDSEVLWADLCHVMVNLKEFVFLD